MDARTEPGQVTSLSHKQARPIVFGMLLPVFMGSLDNTILASALPTIGREFNDVHNLPWLITIYLLASTAIVPLYGKVSDIYGRQFALRIAIVLYMLGSLACALAPSMLALILGRALHGLGGGGLASTGAIVLGAMSAHPRSAGATTPISRWSTPRPAPPDRRSAAFSPTICTGRRSSGSISGSASRPSW
jgi:MFS family permease